MKADILATILEPSYKSLYIEPCFENQKLGNATGFIVKIPSGHVLITNRHVVTGRNNITGKLLDSQTASVPTEIIITHLNSKCSPGTGWIKVMEPLYKADIPLWIEHPTLHEKADIVAIKLTATKGARFFPYEIKDNSSFILRPTDIVSVVGFPFGLCVNEGLAIWATGFIASDPEVNYDKEPVFLIDCRSRSGQSGSPVIAQRNVGQPYVTKSDIYYGDKPRTEFLGVYSGRINCDSDIGIVWKASAIKELVDSIK